MNRSIIRVVLPVLTALIFIFSCAKVSSPTGGPKDREPPVIIKSIPLTGTKNFSGKEIVITFDEYVVLDKINEKFMVSPPMKKKPGVFVRGKNVHVEFEDNLKDSTTYTFYFQDAIRDLNEGNIIDNYQFVFSTGPVIDSLSVTGNVYNAFNLEAPANTLVLLHERMADSAVKKQIPDYITRVEKNGEFRIDNVRKGKYRIYALKDLDNSKNFNLREEEFAFMTEPVEINPSKNYLPVKKDTAVVKTETGKIPIKAPIEGEYKLILFTSEKKSHYLTSSDRKLPYQLIYTLSLPPDSMKFDFSIPGTEKDDYFIEESLNKDTIIVWLTDSTLYSQQQISAILNYPFTDTLGMLGYKDDTIPMRYLMPRSVRSKVKRTPYKINTGIISGLIGPGKQLILRTSTPLRQPDTSRIRFYELIKGDKIKVPISLLKDSINSCRYFLNTDLQQGKDYLFIADSAAFKSIYGEYSDSTGIKFTVRLPESYGKLILNIENYEGARIVQLLTNTEELIKEVKMEKDGKLEFPLLEKGFYRLRVIYDLNGDGKWTTGDFESGRQPEPVSYYPDEIEIKVNWEDNKNWDLGAKNFKNFKMRSSQKSIK